MRQGLLALGLVAAAPASAGASAWHVHYDRGIELLRRGDAPGAEAELRRALERRARSGCRARKYGILFREYVPHYQLALALLAQGRDADAAVELSRELAEGVIGSCAGTRGLDADLRARLSSLAIEHASPAHPPAAAPRPEIPAAPLPGAAEGGVAVPAPADEAPAPPALPRAGGPPPTVAPLAIPPLLGLDWARSGRAPALLPARHP